MEIISLVPAFGAGLVLGAFFSISLWASVRRMVDGNSPWYVLYGGSLLRMAVVAGGLFFAASGRWERMIAALAGFLVMRTILGRFLSGDPGEAKEAAWRS